MSEEARYPPQSPISTALRARCPRCGQGKLFDGYLTVAPACRSCGLDFSFADSGDGPAVFIILIVGFIVVAAALVVEVSFQPPYLVHALLWVPLIILLPLLILRPAKALMVALQYKHGAQEGRRSR